MDVSVVSVKGDEESLQILWSDGVTHRLTWRLLRERCPCAVCRDKQTKRPPSVASASAATSFDGGGLLPILTPQEARPLRVQSMRPAGNYAYGIDFTDGHTSGIYSLELLRELGEEAATTE